MKTERYVEAENLSTAWAKMVNPMLHKGGGKEVAPIVVTVTGFRNGAPIESDGIRSALDQTLLGLDLQSCDTVANTIFPQSLWNPNASRQQLYDRYLNALPRLRKASPKNARGLYFERMIIGGSEQQPNQLEFVLSAYGARSGVRRSALQVSTFDPKVDHTTSALIGFPCLQHVTFVPTPAGLCVNAFYATQYAIERAYGNYLGLCRLGNFVAQELRIPLARMTCFTGLMKRDDRVRLKDVRLLASAISAVLAGADSREVA